MKPRPPCLVPFVKNPDNLLVDPSSPETVVLGKVATPPCPAPSNTSVCIPSGRSDTRSGLCALRPTGRSSSCVGDAGAPRPTRWTSGATGGRSCTSIGPGLGCPATPSDRLTMTSSTLAQRSTPRDSSTCSGSTPRPQGGLGGRRRGRRDEGGARLRHPGQERRVAVLLGRIRAPRHSGDGARCAGPGGEYAKEGTPAAATGAALYDAIAPEGVAIVAGPTDTGDLFPDTYRGDVCLGDYAKNPVSWSSSTRRATSAR